MIFAFVGTLNVVLQFLTRNLIFAYLGLICLAIYTLSLFPKLERFGLILGCISLLGVIAYSLYSHSLYGAFMTDYAIIAVEALLCLILSIIYLLPSKEPPSIEGGSVSFKGQVEFAIHPKSFPYVPQIELLHTLINLFCL